MKGGEKALNTPQRVVSGWWRQLGQDRLCVRALINHFLSDLLTTSTKHQKQHYPMLLAGQDVSSQQDIPLLTASESMNSTGLLCQTQRCGVVSELNQHSGSPSPAFSCFTSDLHNIIERLSSLKCEPVLWPLHSYPEQITLPAFTLL